MKYLLLLPGMGLVALSAAQINTASVNLTGGGAAGLVTDTPPPPSIGSSTPVNMTVNSAANGTASFSTPGQGMQGFNDHYSVSASVSPTSPSSSLLVTNSPTLLSLSGALTSDASAMTIDSNFRGVTTDGDGYDSTATSIFEVNFTLLSPGVLNLSALLPTVGSASGTQGNDSSAGYSYDYQLDSNPKTTYTNDTPGAFLISNQSLSAGTHEITLELLSNASVPDASTIFSAVENVNTSFTLTVASASPVPEVKPTYLSLAAVCAVVPIIRRRQKRGV